MVKQLTNFILPIIFDDMDAEQVSRIEFVFRPSPNSESRAIKECEFPTDVQYDEELGAYLVEFSINDTADVCGTVYCDTRVWLDGSIQNPGTDPFTFKLPWTLFRKEM